MLPATWQNAAANHYNQSASHFRAGLLDANQHDQSREQAGEQHPAPVVFAQRKDAVDEV